MSYAETKMMKDREMAQESFARLLRWLDEDAARAGEKYVEIHRRLCEFFAARGCPRTKTESLADETFDRVDRRLAEGTMIEAAPKAYCFGVARLVALEYYRNPERDFGPLDELLNQGFEDTSPLAEPSSPLAEDDPYLECLERCLQTLSLQDRSLILAYYQANDPALKKKERSGFLKRARAQLLEHLGKSERALNAKTVRIRNRLKQCVLRCLEQFHPQQNA